MFTKVSMLVSFQLWNQSFYQRGKIIFETRAVAVDSSARVQIFDKTYYDVKASTSLNY